MQLQIICYLNINSFRNKFVFVEDIIELFDVFLVSKSKLRHKFLSSQFRIKGYKIFRLDLNRFGGEIILHTKKDISCKPLHEHIFKILMSLQFNFTKIIKNGF